MRYKVPYATRERARESQPAKCDNPREESFDQSHNSLTQCKIRWNLRTMNEPDLIELVQQMPDNELTRTLREVRVGLSMLNPASAMYWPARAYLTALNAEHARRDQGKGNPPC